MLNPDQEVESIQTKQFRCADPNRHDIFCQVKGEENMSYYLGDYFPLTGQIQFYGARLTPVQIYKVIELIQKGEKECS